MLNEEFDPLSVLVGDSTDFDQGLPDRPRLYHLPSCPLAGLVSLAILDDIMSTVPLRHPFVYVSNCERAIPESDYSYGTGAGPPELRDWIDPVALTERIGGGHSVMFSFLDFLVPSLGSFCHRLAARLGLTVGVDAFFTPPNSRAFAHHYDKCSSFVIQVEGTKVWELFEPTIVAPLSDYHPWTGEGRLSEAERRRISGPPDAVHRLAPGDVLWIPRGTIHFVYCEESPSFHVTLSVSEVTRHTVARAAVELLARVEDLRVDLRPGFWHDQGERLQVIEDAKEAVVAAIRELDTAELADRVVDGIIGRMRTPQPRPIATVLGLPADRVEYRVLTHEIPKIERLGSEVVLRLRDREIAVSGRAADFVVKAMTTGRVLPVPGDEELNGVLDTLWQCGVLQRLNT